MLTQKADAFVKLLFFLSLKVAWKGLQVSNPITDTGMKRLMLTLNIGVAILLFGPCNGVGTSGADKSLSEALIFASTNQQYKDKLFIELQVQYMKIQWTICRHIVGLLMQKWELLTKINLYWNKLDTYDLNH